jgi:hypothetical protein
VGVNRLAICKKTAAQSNFERRFFLGKNEELKIKSEVRRLHDSARTSSLRAGLAKQSQTNGVRDCHVAHNDEASGNDD